MTDRWKIGNYAFTYNPHSNSLDYASQNNPINTLNGLTTNVNLFYDKKSTFEIDLYEHRTYIDSPTPLSANTASALSYISISEDQTNEYMILLSKKNLSGTYLGAVDKFHKDGSYVGTYNIVSGNSITPPNAQYLKSVTYTNTGMAILYNDGTESTILLTDENAVVNRNYIYTDQGTTYDGSVGNLVSIAWDFNKNIYGLNQYGNVYAIDRSTGTSSLIFSTDDCTDNLSTGNSPYNSIGVFEDQGYLYIIILTNKNTLNYYDFTGNIRNSISTITNNINDFSFCNYSGDTYFFTNSFGNGNLIKLHPNTVRIDLDIIKKQISSGQVTAYDENSVPMVLDVTNIQITRKRNMNEARYVVQFQATIAYKNRGYNMAYNSVINK